jgi:hypothetical protein
VQAETDDQRHGEADLVRRRGLADREALREVVDADADRDQEREPDRRVRQIELPALGELVEGGRARADEGRRAPPAVRRAASSTSRSRRGS